jgi:hypothetical protein
MTKEAEKANFSDRYDPHIKPAETAAREEREGENFEKLPEKEGDLDTTGG